MVRHLSNDMRRLVIRYSHEGRSLNDITALVRVNGSTVSRILKRYRQTGEFAPGTSTGRPRSTNIRDDRVLFRTMEQDRRASARSLANSWSVHLNRCISRRTTNRRMTRRGFRARRLIKQPFLTQRNRALRLDWARQHANLTVHHWRHVIFTDESRVMLDAHDGRQRVRRMRGQPLQEADIQPMRQGAGGSVHIWGAIHYGGKSELRILVETVNGARYQQLLTDYALPYCRGVYQNNFVWQHDNAPAHKCHAVTTFLANEGITVLPWPACSPDCNPIENCWDRLKREVYSMVPRPQNLAELTAALHQAWRGMDQAYVNRLIDSMPRRVTSVINANGRHTTY